MVTTQVGSKVQPKKPLVSRELLQWLKDTFPNQVPNVSDSDRTIWIKVGSQEVIRHLQKLYNDQQ